MTTNKKTIRIGGASGFWGDSAVGANQLVDADIDYLVFDYLAELTMSILAAARAKKPELGYATDFVNAAMRDTLKRCVERGIKVISNAGGINPAACAQAVEKLAEELGVKVKVAIVHGDDVMPLLPSLKEKGIKDFYTGAPIPEKLISANAYLGAMPIAAALAAGADVVITGRVVDSAVVLGALIHEFGWKPEDYDQFSGASLAGHIIECGCQATGGLHTDWRTIPDWDKIGYPIVECAPDGSFVVTKPENTGGKILALAVSEQMLYEIHDPAAYILPDVICDFSAVEITQLDADHVLVRGARGSAPTDAYKVSATYQDGFTCAGVLAIVGFEAAAKALRTGEAILTRTSRMLKEAGLGDYTTTNLELLGVEEPYGANANPDAQQPFEAVVKITTRHTKKEALALFAREIAPSGTSFSPGTVSGLAPGRPSVSPLVRLFSFLVPKSEVFSQMTLGDGAARTIEVPPGRPYDASAQPATQVPPFWKDSAPEHAEDDVEVPLIRIAVARSGDKGDTSNIGVIARSEALLPYMLREVTAERVKQYFAHYVQGEVIRHPVPGIDAVNFEMKRALDGGGLASMRLDKLGKSLGQILLRMPVRVPARLLEKKA
ncbi:MAG: acyclic terpene utilization AtuA family protein [Burkholderiaceae bacterium]